MWSCYEYWTITILISSLTEFLSTNERDLLCVSVLKITLFNTPCRFINIELLASSAVASEWGFSNTSIFPVRHIHCLLVLGTLDKQHLSTVPKGPLEQWNPQQCKKMWKPVTKQTRRALSLKYESCGAQPSVTSFSLDGERALRRPRDPMALHEWGEGQVPGCLWMICRRVSASR